MADKKKVLIEVELGEFQFQCEGCKTIVDESAYCIAQRAMGHDLTYTCVEEGCGHKTELKARR